MPRCLFDVQNADGLHCDEFVSFEGVRKRCQALLPDGLREELPDGDLHKTVCEVRDETGKRVYRGEITCRGTRL